MAGTINTVQQIAILLFFHIIPIILGPLPTFIPHHPQRPHVAWHPGQDRRQDGSMAPLGASLQCLIQESQEIQEAD
jgi:hypothetical protein